MNNLEPSRVRASFDYATAGMALSALSLLTHVDGLRVHRWEGLRVTLDFPQGVAQRVTRAALGLGAECVPRSAVTADDAHDSP